MNVDPASERATPSSEYSRRNHAGHIRASLELLRYLMYEDPDLSLRRIPDRGMTTRDQI